MKARRSCTTLRQCRQRPRHGPARNTVVSVAHRAFPRRAAAAARVRTTLSRDDQSLPAGRVSVWCGVDPRRRRDGKASIHEVGTLARIVDWYQGSDGLLGVTAQGEDKFALLESWREEDGLNIGRVQRLPPEQAIALPSEHASLSGLLKDVLDDLGIHYQQLPKHYEDAAWVGHRLSEILPISLEQKQYCLELDDPLQRLAALSPVLKELQENR